MDVQTKSFASRMAEVLDIFNGNVSEVARQAGIKPPSVKRWIMGEADPQMSNVVNLANAANVNLLWLATGQGPKFKSPPTDAETDVFQPTPECVDSLGNPVDINDYVFIPRYNVKAAAGSGHYNQDHKSTLRMAFRRYWVDNYLRANPKDLSVISVKGDSMTGVLEDGDTILVNHAKNRPDNGLYVVRINDALVVKRIQSMPGGKLLFTSANEAYAPFEIDLRDESNDVQVVGKVEWFGRQI